MHKTASGKRKNEKTCDFLCGWPFRPGQTRGPRGCSRARPGSSWRTRGPASPAARFFCFCVSAQWEKSAHYRAVRSAAPRPGRNLGLGWQSRPPPGPILAQRGGARSGPFIYIQRLRAKIGGIKKPPAAGPLKTLAHFSISLLSLYCAALSSSRPPAAADGRHRTKSGRCSLLLSLLYRAATLCFFLPIFYCCIGAATRPAEEAVDGEASTVAGPFAGVRAPHWVNAPPSNGLVSALLSRVRWLVTVRSRKKNSRVRVLCS